MLDQVFRIVTDQESSLMTVAAGDEFQRLSIEQRPAGTTSGGRQGQRHTTTGLVEKHVDLIKLTVLKMHSEARRYGLEVGGDEVAAEAAMAQNTRDLGVWHTAQRILRP